MMQGDLIDDFVHGRWRDPQTGLAARSPVASIVIDRSLAGHEAELVAALGLGGRLAVVGDANTMAALGQRVAGALRGIADIDIVVLDHPHADIETVRDLSARTAGAQALIAVGSGTINDLCKHATFLDGRGYAVFGTAASMNGYVTGTASITAGGFKQTLGSHPPRGAFFDLGVLAAAPVRLARAGFGDSICRTTSQVDWLLAHLLLGRRYMEGPYALQREEEPRMLDAAADIARGDTDAMARLVRMLVLGGLGVVLPGTSDPGSQAEHLVSHYIDMLAGARHPGSLHGEQVGVAALTVNRLQHAILSHETPPVLRPTAIDRAAILHRLGPLIGPPSLDQFAGKALDAAATAVLNATLATDWPAIRDRLRAVLLPQATMRAAMDAVGAPTTAAALGLDPGFYREAVLHCRLIRDRYTILDLADDAGLLAALVAEEG